MPDMYRENIMDHYKNPRNHGSMADASISHTGSNPLCGDEIKIDLKISNGVLEKIYFTGIGCAISQASASMLTEEAKGKPLEKIMKMTRDDVLDMLGIPLTPARIKCAVLAMKIVQDAVRLYRGEKITGTTTE